MQTALIEKSRSALVFIEFQAEWLGDDAILFERLVQDKDAFRAAATRAAAVLEAARFHGWNIVHAGLDLRDDPAYRLFAGGQGMLGLRGAIPGAGRWTGAGAAFVAPFVPRAGEFISHGRSGASVLGNANLDAYCRNNRIDTLILMGFATHVCVESTLRGAHDSGFNTWVVGDACAAFTRQQDSHFHEHILHHFGAGIAAAALVRHMAS
ncbi:MAG TPA: isochorismatase [Janthinobacterium sp.]|nr:isochorismatase [Janthinobacterium sp.]